MICNPVYSFGAEHFVASLLASLMLGHITADKRFAFGSPKLPNGSFVYPQYVIRHCQKGNNQMNINDIERIISLPTVFISYSWKDELTALAVDEYLRQKGARVIIDRRDFIVGNDIVDEIIRHITNANKVVVIYSRNSANRPYPTLERRIAAQLEIEDYKRRLIFFCIDDTPLPLEVRHRVAIFAKDKSFKDAMEELWHAIQEVPRPIKRIDLRQFEKTPPWRMNDEQERKAINKVVEYTEDVLDIGPSILSNVKEELRQFEGYPEEIRLERALKLLQFYHKDYLERYRRCEERAKEAFEGASKEEKSFPEALADLTIALYMINAKSVVDVCQKAIDEIETWKQHKNEIDPRNVWSNVIKYFEEQS